VELHSRKVHAKKSLLLSQLPSKRQTGLLPARSARVGAQPVAAWPEVRFVGTLPHRNGLSRPGSSAHLTKGHLRSCCAGPLSHSALQAKREATVYTGF